eukprot:1151945-Pelagomonas_calceolata.AAC.1
MPAAFCHQRFCCSGGGQQQHVVQPGAESGFWCAGGVCQVLGDSMHCTPIAIDTGVVGNAKGGERLKVASGVQEARIECLDKEREALLYYILV